MFFVVLETESHSDLLSPQYYIEPELGIEPGASSLPGQQFTN